MEKSFGKLKSFSAIMCLENFSKNAYLDIDKTPKKKPKYKNNT